MKTFLKIFKFYDDLEKLSTPGDISVLDPYTEPEIRNVYKKFYKKYFNDSKRRILIFGINPGRFGGGITGIPFTDSFNLKKRCQIDSNIPIKKELSSKFIYEMIEVYGGVKTFYNNFFISSICPYGFTKDGKNLNYYDDKTLFHNWERQIVKWIRFQVDYIVNNKCCVIIGKGKNQKIFELLNKEYKFFDEIIALPHPRWILQYKSKQKNFYIKTYINTLNKLNYE